MIRSLFLLLAAIMPIHASSFLDMIDGLEFYCAWPLPSSYPPSIQRLLRQLEEDDSMRYMFEMLNYLCTKYRKNGVASSIFGLQSLTKTGQQLLRELLRTITTIRRDLKEGIIDEDRAWSLLYERIDTW